MRIQLRFTFTLTLLIITLISFAQTATIRGFVYDTKAGEPVIFTNVYLKGTTYGAATDVNGYYSITKIEPGTYTLVTTFVGMDTATVNITLKKGQILTRKLFLSKAAKELRVFNLSAEHQETKTHVKMSVTKITPKDIERIVTIGGESDLVSSLSITPGIIMTGDQGGQLYIRGGSPIQNKVLMDGMIIYNPFHSIGLFSVFDTDIIRNADVYTGGFNAQYGGRISSIMDITTRDGNKKRLAGKIGATPFGAKALIEGPILKEQELGGSSASFILSGKHSYLAQSSKYLYSYVDTAGLPFNYTDLYGKISFNGVNGSKVNFFGFNYSDKVNYQAVSDLSWNSYGAGTNFIMVPGGSPVFIEGAFSYSEYGISLTEEDKDPRTSSIAGFNGGLDFTYFIGDNEIKYGIEVLGFSTKFDFYNEVGRKIEQNENTTEAAGYFKYKWNIGKFVLEPSFRAHYYASLDEFSPEPRFGAKYNLHDKIRLKAAGGVYSQNLMSANSDRDVVNLFYGFLSGPENLPKTYTTENLEKNDVTSSLQRANHIIIGGEYDITSRIMLNVEGYYKRFVQVTNINRNKIYDDISENAIYPESERKDYVIEVGNAYGVDFVVKYDYKRLYLWFVYSLGKVDRFDGVLQDDDGNYISYNPIFDRRHNINFVGSYTFGKNLDWQANIRWNLGSGFPFTQTQGFYEKVNFENGIDADYTTANGDLGVYYGSLNQGRLPYYHRLDLSIKKKFIISENSVLEVNAGVTNAYNRENIFYFDRIKYKRVNQLPFLPSLGMTFTF